MATLFLLTLSLVLPIILITSEYFLASSVNVILGSHSIFKLYHGSYLIALVNSMDNLIVQSVIQSCL